MPHCFPAGLFLCLLAVGLSTLAGAEEGTGGVNRAAGDAGQPSAPAASGQEGSRVLSEREALALAGRLMQAGHLEEAREIYAAVLEKTRNEDFRVEAGFQLAQILLREGKYRAAASSLQIILNTHPDLPRVRLDLARAYFLDKNYEDAAFQFELVKGGDLPPPVLEKVEVFLDLIRRQKDWTLDFFLTPVSDSNISQASGGSEECIDTTFGTLCRPLEAKKSGFGLSGGATLDYFRRISRDWGLRATVGLNGLMYEQRDYDDHTLYMALGPRRLWESGEASLQPTFRKRWYGGKEYSREYGMRLDARQNFGPLILDGGASWGTTDYDDPYVHSFLHGQSWGFRFQPRYILNERTFVQAGAQFLRDETRARAYASDNWRYALGAYRILPHSFALFLEGSLARSGYKAPQWYVTRDNRLDETTRKDTVWGFTASLSSSAFTAWGLTPVLQYSYIRRDSNIWTRGFDRHRLNLMVNIRF
ncbi:MAG: tetratricopeptide repeat protein [Deltaproteobacteria bacterium]|jgi:hypothetical protein|nr:tetratricopeptide repeat protein [Deltaproteobacteria bacterium]